MGHQVRKLPLTTSRGSGRYCLRAGSLRNEQMLRCGQPDQVIPGDPIKLSYIPTEPVISIITPWAIVTIVAHKGDGQMVYDVLSLPNIFIKNLALQYAEHYLQESVMDFTLNAMSNEQIRNVEQNTGVNLPLDDQDR